VDAWSQRGAEAFPASPAVNNPRGRHVSAPSTEPAIEHDPSTSAGLARRILLLLSVFGFVVVLALVATNARDDGPEVSSGPPPTEVPLTVPPGGPTSSDATSTAQRPVTGSGEPVTIVFAGDMNAEGVLEDRLGADPGGFVGPFAPIISGADLAVGNLETAITERGTPVPGKSFSFRAPPAVLDGLRMGGFDTVSLANNHGMDFGIEGLEDSVAAKRASGDDFVIGIGLDEAEAYAPYSTEINGQRIAVVGATQVLDGSLIDLWTAGPDKGGLASAKRNDRLVQAVVDARADHDTVIVFLHWGIEAEECPAQRQFDLATELEAAGADVIVGGHAHRVQGGGRLGSAVVHYGLGNFLFRANSAAGARTGVFRVTVTGQEVNSYEWIPGQVQDSVPQALSGPAAADEVARWEAQRGCTNLTP